MRPSNTGKSDPQPTAPIKRGFFAAAGERLKRAMSGPRAPAAASAYVVQESEQDTEGELTTSVQAKARELLQQDRSSRRGPARTAGEDLNGTGPSRTGPPPLPSQRMAADAAAADAGHGDRRDRPSSAQPKRPVRDSKSDALRARLGAAKAALAEAQAKRAAEQASSTQADVAQTEGDATPEGGALPPGPMETSEVQPLSAAVKSAPETEADADGAEPIQTLAIARLLASQGYLDRSLSVYEQLLSENADDAELRAEMQRVREQLGDAPTKP